MSNRTSRAFFGALLLALALKWVGVAGAALDEPLARTPERKAVLLLEPLSSASDARQGRAADQPDALRLRFQSARRARLAARNRHAPDLASLTSGDTLVFNLFSDVQLSARIERVDHLPNGILSIGGSVHGDDYGHFALAARGGRLLADVQLPARRIGYRIRYLGNEFEHLVQEIDPAHDDIVEPGPAIWPLDSLYLTEDAPLDAVIGQDQPAAAESVTTVDLMILYTPAAARWAAVNATSIDHVIAQATQKANLALANSNIGSRLRLVYSGRIDYAESGSGMLDLNRLTFHAGFDPWNQEGNPRYLEDVPDLRDRYGADVVSLFELIDDGGWGWLLDRSGGDPELAYSIVRVQQAASSFTMIHEIGHNHGAHHAANQSFQPGPGLFSFSSGWRWTGADGGDYCSVMAYESGSYFSDGIDHQQVAHFSNPDILYQSVPTGAQSANNARTLSSTAVVVARYRDAASADSLPDLVATSVTAPGSGAAGGYIEVAGTVKNIGLSTAGSSWMGYFLSTDPIVTTADQYLGDGCSIGPLAPGETADLCAGSIMLPADMASGTYYFGAYADTDQAVAEADEANNGAVASGAIAIDAVSVWSSSTEFVAQQYRDFLGREGAASEIAPLADQLASGAIDREDVVQVFFDRADYDAIIAPVARLYFAYFRRIPDFDGLMFWMDDLRQTGQLSAISQSFSQSMEFNIQYGALNDRDFVTLVYRNVMNRDPDADGLRFWVDQLAGGMARGEMMLLFSDSIEYGMVSEHWIDALKLYTGLLRRSPSQTEFDAVVNSLDGGASSLTSWIGIILSSSEYQSRFSR